MRVAAAAAVSVGSWLGQIGWLAAPGGVVIPHLYNPLLIYLQLLFIYLPRLLSLGTPVSIYILRSSFRQIRRSRRALGE